MAPCEHHPIWDAVYIASRVMSHADPEAILVTRTILDVVAGSVLAAHPEEATNSKASQAPGTCTQSPDVADTTPINLR